MTLTNAGNLGIGITNPFATLTLRTPIIAAGISNPSFVIARNNGSGNRNFKMAIDDIGRSEPMQNDQAHFFNDIFLKIIYYYKIII
jgi:hypothetical protein